MKLRTIFVLLLLLPSNASAVTRYIAQTAGVFSGGSACNGKTAMTPATWNATAEVGGDINYICGPHTGTLNTTLLTFSWSGTSGNVISLIFDTGASLSSPAWPATGAINLNGSNYILIDGGTNGTITTTANGSTLANALNSLGVYGGNPAGTNIEVKNLTVSNMYVRSVTTDNCQCGVGISIGNGSIANILVHNNTVSDAYEGVVLTYAGTSSNFQIYSNTIFHTSTGIVTGGGNSSVSLATELVHDNEVYDGSNWSGDWTGLHGCVSDCHFHNQPIHVWAVLAGDAVTGLQIYNNYLHGDWGSFDTAWIYPEGLISNHVVYNNIIQNNNASAGPTNAYIFLKCAAAGCTNAQVYNNTIWSQAASSPLGTGIELQATEQNVIIKNNIFINTNYGIYVDPSDTSSISVSNNNDFYPATMNFFNHSGPVSLATWTANWGFDANSITGNPNLNASNYRPASGSPVILAALNLTSLGITGLNSDKGGVARPASGNWDMGVYQFNSTSPAVGLSPTSIAFGNIVNGTTSGNQTITLCNGSWAGAVCNAAGASLTITSITLTGTNAAQFAIAQNNCGASLAAGSTCTVLVNFTPNAVASFSANLTYTTNAASSPDNAPLSGSGVAAPGANGIATPGIPFGFTAVPLPPPPAQPSILSISPTQSYVTAQGCSQDGVKWANPCVITLSCSGCGSGTQVIFAGVAVPAVYSAGKMVASMPLSLIPVPVVPTQYAIAVNNPVSALPILQ